MLAADFQDLIIIFIERIFLPCHTHPGKDQGTAAGYDIHLALVGTDLIDGLSCDATVQCYEIHAVFRV